VDIIVLCYYTLIVRIGLVSEYILLLVGPAPPSLLFWMQHCHLKDNSFKSKKAPPPQKRQCCLNRPFQAQYSHHKDDSLSLNTMTLPQKTVLLWECHYLLEVNTSNLNLELVKNVILVAYMPEGQNNNNTLFLNSFLIIDSSTRNWMHLKTLKDAQSFIDFVYKLSIYRIALTLIKSALLLI
jgi:hypothetical protein